jgi:hypothetical protein
LPDPTLRNVLVRALRHHGGIVLDDLRVYVRPDDEDPDLHYCLTWGSARYAAGTLRWWPDIQRLADEPQRLAERFPDWQSLVLTICSALGLHMIDGNLFLVGGRRLGRVAISAELRRKAGELDDALRSRLANAVGGYDDVEYLLQNPREGLVEELPNPLTEPLSRYERLLDDDNILDRD